MELASAELKTANTLAIVLATCTRERAGERCTESLRTELPAALRRSVDWSLANCIGSGMRRIAVLGRAHERALHAHVERYWGLYRPEAGEFIAVWANDAHACPGDAVLLHRQLPALEALAPRYVLVLSGHRDQRVDYRPLLAAHVERGGGATVGCFSVPIEAASAYDVVCLDGKGRVARLAGASERLGEPADRSRSALASLGVYVIDRELLADCLAVDADDPQSRHDFCADVLPMLASVQALAPYRYADMQLGGRTGTGA